MHLQNSIIYEHNNLLYIYLRREPLVEVKLAEPALLRRGLVHAHLLELLGTDVQDRHCGHYRGHGTMRA